MASYQDTLLHGTTQVCVVPVRGTLAAIVPNLTNAIEIARIAPHHRLIIPLRHLIPISGMEHELSAQPDGLGERCSSGTPSGRVKRQLNADAADEIAGLSSGG